MSQLRGDLPGVYLVVIGPFLIKKQLLQEIINETQGAKKGRKNKRKKGHEGDSAYEGGTDFPWMDDSGLTESPK